MGAAKDNSQQAAQFTQDLLCPDCGQKGSVTWEENAGAAQARRLVNLSGGFHIEEGRTRAGDKLVVCDNCDTIQDD